MLPPQRRAKISRLEAEEGPLGPRVGGVGGLLKRLPEDFSTPLATASGGRRNAPQARHRRPPLTGSGTGGLKGRKQGRENNGICAGPDRRLYCAPRGASTVLVVDPKTDKLSFIRRPKDGQAKLH